MIQQPKKQNPLANLMRQPKIYIKLPSNGEFWTPGSLIPTETGEYPVYSMTAKDELMLKIPDALINGQAIVEVIQHCIPNIKNAWAMPNIDLDIILIAIRIATYGEKMEVPIPNSELTYDLDLRYLMAQLQEQIRWVSRVDITPELVVYVKPITYKQLSESSLQAFETQRILQIASNPDISDEDKNRTFQETFKKLNDMTIGLVNNAIYKIDSSEGSTDDRMFIKEFIDNADKLIFDKVKEHMEALKEVNSVKPLRIQPTKQMIEDGTPDETIEIPLIFDPTTFFA